MQKYECMMSAFGRFTTLLRFLENVPRCAIWYGPKAAEQPRGSWFVRISASVLSAAMIQCHGFQGPSRPGFGSALNANIHFHMLFLDAVYVDGANGLSARFQWTKPPTSAELTRLTHTHARRARGLAGCIRYSQLSPAGLGSA